MAAKRGELVPRPPKKIEYEIRYASVDAEAGRFWRGAVMATSRRLVTSGSPPGILIHSPPEDNDGSVEVGVIHLINTATFT